MGQRDAGQFDNIHFPLELQQIIEGKIMWGLFKYFNELPLDGRPITAEVIADSGSPHSITPPGPSKQS